MKPEQKAKKKRLRCSVCSFILTAGNAKAGDVCPWCSRGILNYPKKT